uniref:Uncharacterized protein n=1 Tax=Arundo donax TaxID=35708 RepID=A0A0A9CV20_ARUDO
MPLICTIREIQPAYWEERSITPNWFGRDYSSSIGMKEHPEQVLFRGGICN